MIGYRSRFINPKTGRRKLVFSLKDTDEPDVQFPVSRGTCKSCLLKHARERAVRCVHEAKQYEDNCFVTLTYSDSFLPPFSSIDPPRIQTFMKDLRARVKYHEGKVGIRSFGCAEYGGRNGRPHYHILLFNYDFKDRVFWKTSKSGEAMDRSSDLELLWPDGHSVVQDMTYKSASYVARYVLKKQKPVYHKPQYVEIDGVFRKVPRKRYGEAIDGKLPQRPVAVSLKPGIGKAWLEKWFRDVYPLDSVSLDGRSIKPPKYYDRLYEKMFPEEFDVVKERRAVLARKKNEELVGRRALVIDRHIQLTQIDKLKRSLDDDEGEGIYGL